MTTAPAVTEAVPGRRAWAEPVMGTVASIHVRADDPARPDVEAGVARVLAHLRRAESVLSTWRADSDLLRLQHGETDEPHPWVADVTALALEAEERTGGLFTAWRPRAGGRPVFDPTGLVKGWAVAGAAEHLAVVPGVAYAVGVGGDVVVGSGPGTPATTWRIGVEDARRPGRVTAVVPVSRGAVATSGAARRGGHVVDPRTGRGVARGGSATVVGPDLLWADVWATAGWVDPVRARVLMARRDTEYRLLHC